MSESPTDDWTADPRRLFGHEYSQYNEISTTIENTRIDNLWTITYEGKRKTPPEMMPIELGPSLSVYGVLYDLNKFEVANNQTGKSVDLVKFTAKEWTQKVVALSSPDYTAPEVVDAFKAEQFVDANKRECVVNSYLGPTGETETLVKIIIWNTLISRFAGEVGNPMSAEGFEEMKRAILEKRQIILDVLKGKSPGDATDEQLWSFKSPSPKP